MCDSAPRTHFCVTYVVHSPRLLLVGWLVGGFCLPLSFARSVSSVPNWSLKIFQSPLMLFQPFTRFLRRHHLLGPQVSHLCSWHINEGPRMGRGNCRPPGLASGNSGFAWFLCRSPQETNTWTERACMYPDFSSKTSHLWILLQCLWQTQVGKKSSKTP